VLFKRRCLNWHDGLLGLMTEEHYSVPGLYQKLVISTGYKILPGNLIAPLRSGSLDYSFSYKASAVQAGARYISLPENVNLGSWRFENFYAKARVKITERKQSETLTLSGERILFTLTISKTFSNQEISVSWIDFLLGDVGAAIMKDMGMNPLRPALVAGRLEKLPEV
jgi:molybdate/tungstate transport system substrate-binding protein